MPPIEPVKATVEAVKEKQNIQVILTGQERCDKGRTSEIPGLSERQNPCGTHFPGDRDRGASGNGDPEKERLLYCSRFKSCKKQEADAFVSSGSTELFW